VTLERVLPGKRPATRLTAVRPVTGVTSLVTPAVVRVAERPGADGTGERAVVGVDSQVTAERRREPEPLPTLRTPVRPVPGVGPTVLGEVGPDREGLPTDVTAVGPMSGVSARVDFEVAEVAELDVADGTGESTLVRGVEMNVTLDVPRLDVFLAYCARDQTSAVDTTTVCTCDTAFSSVHSACATSVMITFCKAKTIYLHKKYFIDIHSMRSGCNKGLGVEYLLLSVPLEGGSDHSSRIRFLHFFQNPKNATFYVF